MTAKQNDFGLFRAVGPKLVRAAPKSAVASLPSSLRRTFLSLRSCCRQNVIVATKLLTQQLVFIDAAPLLTLRRSAWFDQIGLDRGLSKPEFIK